MKLQAWVQSGGSGWEARQSQGCPSATSTRSGNIVESAAAHRSGSPALSGSKERRCAVRHYPHNTVPGLAPGVPLGLYPT